MLSSQANLHRQVQEVDSESRECPEKSPFKRQCRDTSRTLLKFILILGYIITGGERID